MRKLVNTRGFVLVMAAALLGTAFGGQRPSTQSGAAHAVQCDRFGSDPEAPILILLHGVSGPGRFYMQQGQFFAGHGFRVVLPHYLDATRDSSPTDEHYDAWVAAVRTVMNESSDARDGQPRGVVIVGYSLGASVALALGSEGNGPDAIADLYGSLPDKYFRQIKGMPPLLILHGDHDANIPVSNAVQLARLCSMAKFNCTTHIYPGEGHGFSPESLRDADRRVLEFFSGVRGGRTFPQSR